MLAHNERKKCQDFSFVLRIMMWILIARGVWHVVSAFYNWDIMGGIISPGARRRSSRENAVGRKISAHTLPGKRVGKPFVDSSFLALEAAFGVGWIVKHSWWVLFLKNIRWASFDLWKQDDEINLIIQSKTHFLSKFILIMKSRLNEKSIDE